MRPEKKKALKAWRQQHQDEAAARQAQVVRHERWYFLVHLSPEDQERDAGQFEVQFLDEQGRGAEHATYSSPTDAVILGGSAVPESVLSAAGHLPAGQGCYVDTEGWELTPFGARVAPDKARATGGRSTAE
jgi:hypothetical protein